jgi:hypothetical protein
VAEVAESVEPVGPVVQRCGVELVLMGLGAMLAWLCHESVNAHLQISQLGEWLAAVVELASVWLGLEVDQSVGSHVSTLSEVLAADVAIVWTLTGMAALVRLGFVRHIPQPSGKITHPEVAHLGEILIANIARLRRSAA